MSETERKCLALTFDDGPNESTMPEIMALLNQYDAKATFFVVGNAITKQTEPVLRTAVAQGFEIGNHSMNHLHMSHLSIQQMAQEVAVVQEQVERITGAAPVLFRPPYLDVNEQMLQTIRMPFISGFGNNDWDPDCSVAQRVTRALCDAENGAILLMHCFVGNDATVEALQVILPELKRQGYRIMTVSQLFAEKNITPKPGTLYEKAVYQDTQSV